MDSTFQDISFSSYLKPQNPTQTPQKNGNCQCHSTTDDTELSIFDAHKYFNESNNPKDPKVQKQQSLPHELLSVTRFPSISSGDGYHKERSFNGTPTASSEVSWNSQTGLLANPQGTIRVSLRNLQNKAYAVKKRLLAMKCCCIGKKSVQVKEVITTDSELRNPLGSIGTENPSVSKCNYAYEHKETAPEGTKRMIHNQLPLLPDVRFEAIGAPRKQRISASGPPFLDGAMSFAFPILSPSQPSDLPALIGTIAKPTINLQKYSEAEVPPVVGLSSIDDRANVISPFNLAITATSDDDAASDASSDLFEIENFSTQAASYPMHRKNQAQGQDSPTVMDSSRVIDRIEYEAMSLDEAAEATDCRAPSKVSIDWSIATADSGDNASVAAFSVSGPKIGAPAQLKQRREESAPGEGDGGQSKGSGLMLIGFRTEKEVSVAAQPVKCPPRGNKPPPMGMCHSAARQSLAFAA